MLPHLPEGLEYSRECVDPSGWGVKATRQWSKGEKIGDYTGTRMPKAEFRQRYGRDITYTYYTHQNLPTSVVIVAKDPRNFIGYVNEGLEPNVELRRYALWCKKDIAIGDELLLRYNKFYNRSYILA
jgi:hypothetical protein